MTGPGRLSLAGAVLTGIVLLICGLDPLPRRWVFFPLALFAHTFLAPLCLYGAILMQVIAVGQHGLRGQWQPAVFAGAILLVGLVLASMPWYVEHWWIVDGTYHRHSMWELPHVH